MKEKFEYKPKIKEWWRCLEVIESTHRTEHNDYHKRTNQELHDLRELVNRLNNIVLVQRQDIETLNKKCGIMESFRSAER